MLRFWLATTTALAMTAGVAAAQTSATVGPGAPQPLGVAEPIMTVAPPASLNGRASEPAQVTGGEGSAAPFTGKGAGNLRLPIYTEYSGPMVTMAAPGSGNQGVSTDDGNATGMIVPGQPPKLVSTPE
jgi:hypothetical protein